MCSCVDGREFKVRCVCCIRENRGSLNEWRDLHFTMWRIWTWLTEDIYTCTVRAKQPKARLLSVIWDSAELGMPLWRVTLGHMIVPFLRHSASGWESPASINVHKMDVAIVFPRPFNTILLYLMSFLKVSQPTAVSSNSENIVYFSGKDRIQNLISSGRFHHPI